MRIVISAPTGYNARELLIPLQPLLESDSEVTSVAVISPAAPWAQQVFASFSNKFTFHENPHPNDQAGHNSLLKQLQPDIVVTPTSGLDPHDLPLLVAAKANNLPTLTFVASWDNVFKMERALKHGPKLEIADRLAVWNHMNKDHLLYILSGISEDDITIVGAPRFDYFAHYDKIPSREQLFDYLDIPNDGGKLLHLATTELYPMEYVVKTIAKAARNSRIRHKLHFYASVHPGGNIANHQQYAGKYNVTVRYSYGHRDDAPLKEFEYNPTLDEIYKLVALFQHSSLLVNHSSTVAIESFLVNVPVINVKYGQPFDWWRWYRSMVYRDFKQHYRYITDDGATTIVTNKRQLINAINIYLDNPSHHSQQRLQTARNLLTYTNGTAGQKLLKLIKQIGST